jgi:hypothetical protein
MAKTVDTYSTIEQFRTKYNELAVDVGDKSGLRTENTQTVIDALNSLEDKSFFFQEFIYTATAGQTTYTGGDDFANVLRLRQDRFQVFKNSTLLLEGADYSISQVTGNIYFRLVLTSGASAGDKVVIYSFTGSYLGTSTIGGQSVGFFTETAANTIFNNNDSGLILNGNFADDASRVTTLTGTNTIEMYGKTFHDGDFTVDTGHTITAPTFTDSTATITGGVGTGFNTITSTIFIGNLSGTTAALSSTVTAGGDITSSTDIIAGSEFVIGNARIDQTDLEKIDDLVNGTVSASKVVVVDSNKDITGFRNVGATGTITAGGDITSSTDIIAGSEFVIGSARVSEAELEILDGATLSTTEINYLDGTTLGNVVASKAVAVSSDKDITGFRNITATGTISTSSELDGGSLDISGNADIDGNLDVGGNLTFNGVTFQEYAQDKVSGLLNHGSHTNITATYDDAADKILLTGVPTYGDNDVAALTVGGTGITETYTGDGNSLTFATDPGDGLIHSGSGVSDKIKLDYEVVSNAPSSVGSTKVGHLWFVV